MRLLVFLPVLLASTIAFAQPAPPQADKKQLLLVVAHDMKVAQSFKHGINFEKTRSGSIGSQAEAALQLDDKSLEEIFADVLASKVSLQDARQAYAFHESPAGKALVAAQAKDPMVASPALDLTPSQIAAVNAYMSSPTGEKFGALISSTSMWDEFSSKVAASLERP